jgi:hypothetical protein
MPANRLLALTLRVGEVRQQPDAPGEMEWMKRAW